MIDYYDIMDEHGVLVSDQFIKLVRVLIHKMDEREQLLRLASEVKNFKIAQELVNKAREEANRLLEKKDIQALTGSRYVDRCGEEYILAQVSSGMFCMIGLLSGNRYIEATDVMEDLLHGFTFIQ